MSKATKRKHVVKEVLEEHVTPTEDQQIMRVLGSNGNNLHEAVTDSGEQFLLSMPPKYRKNLWIKRGDFVIVDPIKEGGKVKGEISFILYRDHIRYLRKLGIWPKGFHESHPTAEGNEGMQNVQNDEKNVQEEAAPDSDSENDDSDLFVNTNRTTVLYSESEEETDDEEVEEECDGTEGNAL